MSLPLACINHRLHTELLCSIYSRKSKSTEPGRKMEWPIKSCRWTHTEPPGPKCICQQYNPQIRSMLFFIIICSFVHRAMVRLENGLTFIFSWTFVLNLSWIVRIQYCTFLHSTAVATLGWPVPPFLSENDSASILSGDACPQDYTTLKIICVASVLGVPQDTTFL